MNASLLDTPLRRLPFSFAKRHGVVFVMHDGRASLAHRADCDPVAPVSYTHLDVYKRQAPAQTNLCKGR